MNALPSVLQKILATKRSEVAERSAAESLEELRERIPNLPETRAFLQHLVEQQASGPAVIAEVKKASPSKGLIRPDFDPAAIARSYQAGGACCLSVLTDRDYFQGEESYLRAARGACRLPVLRKDFIIDPWQVYETRVLGADALLLIVAALDDTQLNLLHSLGLELGLDVLVEVHNEQELQRALALAPKLLGINNRDLHHFTTDLATSERLAGLVPSNVHLVTESGIHSAEDVARMRAAGIHSFLVGEAFMRAADPGAELSRLFHS